MLSDLCLEHLDLLILVVLGLRALLRLKVAPVLVIVLVLLLTHQTEDHLLNHLLDLVKGPVEGADLLSQLLERLGMSRCCCLLQEIHSLGLWILDLQERDGGTKRSSVLLNTGRRFHESLLR